MGAGEQMGGRCLLRRHLRGYVAFAARVVSRRRAAWSKFQDAASALGGYRWFSSSSCAGRLVLVVVHLPVHFFHVLVLPMEVAPMSLHISFQGFSRIFYEGCFRRLWFFIWRRGRGHFASVR